MTTSLQTDPRRAARDAYRKPGRPPLEMPVLFQLADLSRQQAKPAPPTPLLTVAEEKQSAAPEVIAPPILIAEPVAKIDPPKAEAPQETIPTGDKPAMEVPALEAPNYDPEPVAELAPAPTPAESNLEERRTIPAVAMEPIGESTKVEVNSPETIPDVLATSEPVATDVTPPQEPTAPSPRQRAEQRAKSRQAAPSAKSDWMRTQGKFIAIGFVFALIATIYMAQNGDEPPPANPDAAATSHEEAETKTSSEGNAKVTDAHTAKESVSVIEHSHSPVAAEEASPAAGNPSGEAQADLSPSQGDVAAKKSTSSTEVAESKSLFPWKEAGESRVAAKPDTQGTKPPTNPPAKESPSVYGPPSGESLEPTVRQATNESPDENTSAGYPTTDPKNYRDFEPPQSQPAPATTPPRATSPRAAPAANQPGTTNNVPPTRTSGPRYERTGSGLY